jgi:threonine 3-dehydrogenase
MKAIVKSKPERGLWMHEVETPKPGVNEVLLKIRKSAICGTDLHIYKWDEWAQKTIKTPLIIGHEYVGEIVELGAEVNQYKIGDRVTAEGTYCMWALQKLSKGKAAYM